MKIALCLPCYNTDCKIWFAISLAQTIWPKNATVEIMTTIGQITPNACHDLVLTAKNRNADIIMLPPIDMGWEPDAISKLIGHDKDIIGGCANGRLPPFMPHTADGYNEETGLFRIVKNQGDRHGIERIKAGNLMVCKASVFDRIPEPWFWGPETVANPKRMMTEDYYFAVQAIKYGVEFWIDWDVKLTHVVDGLVTRGGNPMPYLGGKCFREKMI